MRVTRIVLLSVAVMAVFLLGFVEGDSNSASDSELDSSGNRRGSKPDLEVDERSKGSDRSKIEVEVGERSKNSDGSKILEVEVDERSRDSDKKARRRGKKGRKDRKRKEGKKGM